MVLIDDNGNGDRQPGSGRPLKVDSALKEKIVSLNRVSQQWVTNIKRITFF